MATLFLALGAAGLFGVKPRWLPPGMLLIYWLPSWLGQSLAAQIMVASAIIAGLGEGTAQVIAVLATVVLFVVHLRNRRDGQAVMAAVKLEERLPVTAGFCPFSSRHGIKRIQGVAYAQGGERNTLDIITSSDAPTEDARVLIHIPGGAWVTGKRNQQARPLIHHLARNGWVCVDINYRLGPRNRFPAMLTDVLRAIAWVKTHIAVYGGDPGRIVLTGGSAGGHLTALAALAHDRDEAKPGFEGVDCAVRAAVALYGRYDFIDRNRLWGRNHDKLIQFAAEKIMPRDAGPQLWDLASPIAQVRGDGPPLLVIHGRHDTLLPSEEADLFADAQRAAGGKVDGVTLSGGQHAYDMLESAMTVGHMRAVRHWLESRM
ncbi:alpha/beta hydrolase [Novosphingobium sp. Gsoil 351]|uniref:alpha/beta hydrolase n=1 Tax=Novosphingobium sp. Gsoil 351 TaxID=2675225 RepID=UPI0018A804AD|nr:alpha/beta hydrolase [Novosphingobium sp. Gsoil 351]